MRQPQHSTIQLRYTQMITYRIYFLSTQSPYAPSLNPQAKGPWERENRRSLTWPDLRMVNQRLKLGQHCDRKSWTYEVLNRPQLSWYFTIYITSLKHVSSAHRREKVKELPSFSEAVGASSRSAKMGANMSNLDVPTNMSRLPNGDHLCQGLNPKESGNHV